MRTNCRYSIPTLAAVLTTTLACFAQAAGDALANGDSATSEPRNDTPPILNAPHTLTRTVTIVQRLSNGTTITRHMTIKQARDSNRRFYSEMHRLAPRPDGQQKDSVVYTLSDPQARTFMQWNSSSRDGIPYTEQRAANDGNTHLSWFAVAYNGDAGAHGRKATNDARRPGNAHDLGLGGQGNTHNPRHPCRTGWQRCTADRN
jgi:hypothetical protein